VSPGTECTELVTLIVARYERDFDARFSHVAFVKSVPGVRIVPAFGELLRMTCRAGSIKLQAVNFLLWPTGVNVSTEKDFDTRRFQKNDLSL